MFIGVYNLPLAVTMLGMALAVGACFLAAHGQLFPALVLFMYAGLADLFDGLVARRMQLDARAGEFGVQIDSLVDVVSFGMTPVVLSMFSLGLSPGVFLICGFYLFCALMRLAWFNLSGTETIAGKRYYTGLPVTYAALIIPLVHAALWLVGAGPGEDLGKSVLVFTLVALGVLFVSRLRVPKPGGIFYGIFPALALVLTVFFLLAEPR